LGADAEVEIEFISVSYDIDNATLHYVPCCRYRGILKIQYSEAQLKFSRNTQRGKIEKKLYPF